MKDDHGRQRGRPGRRIPMEFNIFNSGIAETADKPLFCLSNDEEPSDNHLGVNLHAGPFDLHPKIANLTHRTVVRPGWETAKTMDVVLFETTEKGEGPAKVVLEEQRPTGEIWGPVGRLLWWRASAVQWVFTMQIPCREGLIDADFEWRHSRGIKIRRLRGAAGWMLWRKRTPDEARRTADGRDELVALVSRGGPRPHLGTRFAFANSAARGALGDAFSVVALMSGIGVVLAEKRSLGDCVDALEITARRRSMLARAALVERQAREARDWLDTMELMEDWEGDEPGRPGSSRSDRLRAWTEEQTSDQPRPIGTPRPDPAIARLRRGAQLSNTSRSARASRPLSTSTRHDALTPGRRTASNRSRRYEHESDRFVRSQGGIQID